MTYAVPLHVAYTAPVPVALAVEVHAGLYEAVVARVVALTGDALHDEKDSIHEV
jgi:hypothetical protein